MDEMFGLQTVRNDLYLQADLVRLFGVSSGRISQLIPSPDDGDPKRILRPDLRTISGVPLFSESRIRLLIETEPLLRAWLDRKEGVRPS